jgi:hypothetical protein
MLLLHTCVVHNVSDVKAINTLVSVQFYIEGLRNALLSY